MKNKYLLFGIFIGALIVGLYYFYTADERGLYKAADERGLTQIGIKNADERGSFKGLTATIYKTPNCGCCENYISYLKSNGFKVEKKEVSDEELTNLKKQIGLTENLWSCHTVLLTADKLGFETDQFGLTTTDQFGFETDKYIKMYPKESVPDPHRSIGPHKSVYDPHISVNPQESVPYPHKFVGTYLYFIEGHIPIEAIEKILTEKPEINGIALPQMPSGSSGMPGFKLSPFKIHSIKNGQDQGIFIEI
jgi:hypothetical protein